MRRPLSEICYGAICLGSAIVLTWPLARVFTTRIAGGFGDPHVTLWSMRWMRDALFALQNPFFTPRLYHPLGTTLVFHTFDLPSTLLVLPLWGLLPEVAIYNTAVLFAFTLTAYGMFRLARELTGDTSCALLSGVLFAAVPYHFTHLQGHLHLMSMGWLPLYVVHLLRILSGEARRRDAALGGFFLALACLASWYHLLFAAAITAPLLVYGALRHRDVCFSERFLRQVLILFGTWLVVAGPLLVAMVLAKRHEEILGAHDSLALSADALSFLHPSAIQTWCREGMLNAPWALVGEQATYVGFTVLGLACLGAYSRPLGRAFLVVALLGAVLAMGPLLQWRGDVLGYRMPYWYLERFIPMLKFGGVPVRFGYVMYFGLVAAAALGLAYVRKLLPSAPVSLAVVVAVSASAFYEYRPCPLTTAESPVPAPVRAWASDPRNFAVLDISSGWSQMWHATIHRKPIVGGYLGRVPRRVEDWMLRQPIIRAIEWPDAQLSLSRVDPQVDFAWSSAVSDAELVGDRFEVEWTGKLLVPTEGVYRFWLSTTVGARLQIDQRRVAGGTVVYPGATRLHEEAGQMPLRAGAHEVVLAARETDRDAEIHLSWAPPGEERQIVPSQVLRTADGRSGLDGQYLQHIPPTSGLGRAGGRAALRDLAIRYVITADTDNPCVQDELALPEVYRGESVRIYEVPEA